MSKLGLGGGKLAKLQRIDLSKRDRRLSKVQIDVACNWHINGRAIRESPLQSLFFGQVLFSCLRKLTKIN